ncbi:MAG: hypothetical protein ACNS63_05295 [Candidatus Nitrospinota bacterium M3_3B_026]
MEKDEGAPRRSRPGLPLNEEDLAMAMGMEREEEDRVHEAPAAPPFSFAKLFVTIALAAPVAVFLALMVMDFYPGFARMAGLREEKIIAPEVEKAGAGESEKEKDPLAGLAESIQKSNRDLVAAVNRQTEAALKLAEKKPDVIKVEAPEVKIKPPSQAKAPVVEGPRIVVVKVPTAEKFDLAYEKKKILELSGVDLDDPISASSKPFSAMESRDALKEVIRSLDEIIASSRDHEEVGEFLKNNALEAKKLARQALSRMK